MAEPLSQEFTNSLGKPIFIGKGLRPYDSLPKEQRDGIKTELESLRRMLEEEMNITVFQALQVPIFENRQTEIYDAIIRPLREAIDNAVDHGTKFCTQGTVKVQAWTGEKGILGVVSQKTPGLTQEQIDRAAACENPLDLLGGDEWTETKGLGLISYQNPRNPRVGFELPTEASPIFKVIILKTRQRVDRLQNDPQGIDFRRFLFFQRARCL